MRFRNVSQSLLLTSGLLVITLSFQVQIHAFSVKYEKKPFIASTTASILTPSFTCHPSCVLGNNDNDCLLVQRSQRINMKLHNSRRSDDGDDDDDIDLSNRDWRAFRAQLVRDSSQDEEGNEISTSSFPSSSSSSEGLIEDDLDGIGSLFESNRAQNTPMKTDNFTPLEPSQWAYDSGHVIEQGAVILGGVEQKFGFGLRQQYFHKAVILVLSHDESSFTRGIILNRPSDLILVDDDDGQKWRVWFGGDVQGLDAVLPEIICLHSIPSDNKKVEDVSVTVMNDIKWTTFEDAKKLVREGIAKTSDFWVFAGYAGWGPNQLMGELERKSWYMCATDSQTLLKELAKQSALTDPRDAGLDTWELLMNLIGRGDTVEESSGDFEDLMLKEWAREKLLSVEAGGNAGVRMQPADIVSTGVSPTLRAQRIESFVKKAKSPLLKEKVEVGSLVRAGSADRSPFLLKSQEFHKSIVLIIGEDENVSVGVIINQPSTKAVEMELVDKNTGVKRQLQIPIRFGGQYMIKDKSQMLWMHNNQNLKEAKIGTPVGNKLGIWKCSQDDAIAAIEKGIGRPGDFLIASGMSVWFKGLVPGGEVANGMQGEVENENFEIVQMKNYSTLWEKLQSQKEPLTKLNLMKVISKSDEAWEVAGSEKVIELETDDVVTEGIGEGFDEDNETYVHNSGVKVAKLSDDALRSWIATFLLGAPTLGA